MNLKRLHHAAIICSDYDVSRRFYVELLGLRVVAENHRAARRSHKLDLELRDGSRIELFSFPDPPVRPSWPEARGLRHLAFEVDDVHSAKEELESRGIAVEPIRTDEHTGRRFTFFSDPDGLPLELYEGAPEGPWQASPVGAEGPHEPPARWHDGETKGTGPTGPGSGTPGRNLPSPSR